MNLEDRAYSLLDGIESKLTEEFYDYYCEKVEDCDGDSESLTAVIEELKGVCAKAHSTSKKLSMSDLEGSVGLECGTGEDDLSLDFGDSEEGTEEESIIPEPPKREESVTTTGKRLFKSDPVDSVYAMLDGWINRLMASKDEEADKTHG